MPSWGRVDNYGVSFKHPYDTDYRFYEYDSEEHDKAKWVTDPDQLSWNLLSRREKFLKMREMNQHRLKKKIREHKVGVFGYKASMQLIERTGCPLKRLNEFLVEEGSEMVPGYVDLNKDVNAVRFAVHALNLFYMQQQRTLQDKLMALPGPIAIRGLKFDPQMVFKWANLWEDQYRTEYASDHKTPLQELVARDPYGMEIVVRILTESVDIQRLRIQLDLHKIPPELLGSTHLGYAPEELVKAKAFSSINLPIWWPAYLSEVYGVDSDRLRQTAAARRWALHDNDVVFGFAVNKKEIPAAQFGALQRESVRAIEMEAMRRRSQNGKNPSVPPSSMNGTQPDYSALAPPPPPPPRAPPAGLPPPPPLRRLR